MCVCVWGGGYSGRITMDPMGILFVIVPTGAQKGNASLDNYPSDKSARVESTVDFSRETSQVWGWGNSSIPSPFPGFFGIYSC